MATEPLHVCFAAPNIYPIISGDYSAGVVGGAEVQQSIIARSLVARGYRVSVVCFDFGQPDIVEFDGIAVYKTYRLSAGIPILRFFHPRATSIFSALRTVDADIYYARTASPMIGFVTLFGQIKGKRTIFAAADNSDFSLDKMKIHYRRDQWIFRYGVRNCNHILAQNAEQKRLCLENYHRNATVIRNCIAASANTSSGHGSTVLWVSTIRRIKRPDKIIELARRLPHRRFVMIGGADRYQDELYKKTIALAGEVENLKFLGFIPLTEIDKYFDQARVLVNTSETEGMPNTFLQAWVRSIPTVSFIDCEARHGSDRVGYRVDSVKAMAETVDHLFTNDAEYLAAGKRCLEYCQDNHSIDSTVDRLEAVFRAETDASGNA